MYVVVIILSLIIVAFVTLILVAFRLSLVRTAKRKTWLRKQSKMTQYYVEKYESIVCTKSDFFKYKIIK